MLKEIIGILLIFVSGVLCGRFLYFKQPIE